MTIFIYSSPFGCFYIYLFYKRPEKSGLFFIKFIHYLCWTMDKSNQLFHFMGYKFTQTVTCTHNETLTEKVVVQSKWELPRGCYSISELVQMEDDGDIVAHFENDICNPFYCWNDAMEIIDKIELTPCNDGFPSFVMTSRYFSIEVDGEIFLEQKELNDNKLEILESLVYEFLEYYYTNVEKNN